MASVRTGLVSLSLALGLLGCNDLWRPFLDPTVDASASCGAAGQSCDLATSGPPNIDGSTPTFIPVWINETKPTLGDLLSVYVPQSGQAYAVGTNQTILEWQVVGGWSVISNFGAGPILKSISGNGLSNMFIAASNGQVYRFTGVSDLQPMNPCAGAACSVVLSAVWTTPNGSPWEVGLANEVHRIPDGMMGWTVPAMASYTGQNLYSVWGLSQTDVWIGGADGSLGAQAYHCNGSDYASFPSPGSLSINGFWGRSTTDVWAVGDQGLVMHWSGSAGGWRQTVVPAAANLELHAIAGNNNGELWAVGDNGLILYYDGKSWQQQSSGVTNSLYGVAVSPLDSSPIVVGTTGTLLRLMYMGTVTNTM